jgi:hypothetical protein
MNYLTGEMLNASKRLSPHTGEPPKTKEPPRIHDKDQYDSLLNNADGDDLESTVLASEPVVVHIPSSWRSYRPFLLSLLAVLSIFLWITSLAVWSTSTSRLTTILTQLQGSLARLDTLPSLSSSSSSSAITSPASAAPTVNNPTGNELGHCGRSIPEARSLGCLFDPMSWAWQRPECYHESLVSNFLSRTSWRFYLTNDTSPSNEVPHEVWQRGDYTRLYVSHDWHVFHCAYSWLKFHEAFDAKRPMDNDILQMGHTQHCEAVLLHGLDPNLDVECDSWEGGCRTTQVNAGFNSCGWY